MSVGWRLIVDGDLAGVRNMARDMALLEAVSEGTSRPTLRLYGWSPPCLSLGRHQGPEAADLEFCRSLGIDVVRRPTGGRALLHHLELTYSVVAPLGRGPLPGHLQEAYRAICNALVRTCRTLGVAAELTGGEVNLQLPRPNTAVPCFEAPASGEVVVGGRKLVGSAMRAHGSAMLQHGAILLDWDGRLQAGAMGLDDDGGLRPHITTLAAELGAAPARERLDEVVVQAFAEEFEIGFDEEPTSHAERANEEALESSFSVSA
jgi:lipoate-protein ligase A